MLDLNLKIAAIRRLRRCSQEDIAERAFLSFRTYQRIESGACTLRIDQLMNITQALNCSLNDVVNFDLKKGTFPEKSLYELELEKECAYLKALVIDLNRKGGGNGMSSQTT